MTQSKGKIMKRFILALVLGAVSATANAITVKLITHNWTPGGGTVHTLITDGSHIDGFAASTAVFDWDGTALSSTGIYSSTLSLNSDPSWQSVWNDTITDLSIDTGTSTASGTAFSCHEGTYLASVGHSYCGGHNLGENYINESTSTWGPGLAFSRTLGGDDVATRTQRSISAYDFGLVNWDGITLVIGNGTPVGTPWGEALTFQVVPIPAAAWLFGSALGLLGWKRRGRS